MTSQINPNLINGAFPIAGQDNSSQGFRDNFTNTKENFTTAASEISDLQSKALLAAPLTDGTFNNDMQGNLITNPKLQGIRELIYNFGSVSGSQNIDFGTGGYQTMTLSGSTTINSLANFASTDGSFARIKLAVTVTNAYNTLTFPTSVNVANTSIAGFNTATRTITFDGPGTYVYELSTTNGGTNFYIQDLTNARDVVPGGSFAVTTNVNGNAASGIIMTVSNINGVAIGNITANNFFGNIISLGSNSASFTGNLTANYVIANLGLVGTLTTTNQPNIVSLGNLTSLTVVGNLSAGNITANGMTDMCGGTVYGLQYANIANGGSQTIYSNVGVVIVNFTSNIAGCSLTMPATPVNGQSIKIGFTNNTCATLTHVASGGQTLLAPLTTANQYAGGEWVYHTISTTWHKVT
jgi:hypothetical protein